MSNVAFLWIFSRGMELGVIVLCLLPLRLLLRRKMPRLFSYLLWGALPVNLVYNLVMRFVAMINRGVPDHVYKNPKIIVDESSVQVMRRCWSVGSIIVVLGMVLSYLIFLRRLVGSIRLQEGVYVTDRIHTPFTLGVIHPKIYIPFSLEEKYYESVILHERVHIARRDIFLKYIAVGILGLFWFQPILWLVFPLFINDMEEACDETVLRRKGVAFRKEYAHSLLELSDRCRTMKGAAIGYGSGAIKSRIKNIMNYELAGKKKCAVAILVCCLFMILTIPISWQVPRVVHGEAGKDVKKKEVSISIGDMTKTKLSVEVDEK